ncbi:MAG: ribosome maturation factor RimP [Bacteroidota bacterium]
MEQIGERVREILEDKFKEEGNEDLFLVDVKFNTSKKFLEVFVDSDTGLNIDRCAALNRALQAHIDEAGWLGESYTLDVSSPGVGKPLKLLRQYKKNVGRKLDIFLTEGKPVSGLLTKVEEESITIEFEKGKKKKKELIVQQIPLEKIKKATVQVSFK